MGLFGQVHFVWDNGDDFVFQAGRTYSFRAFVETPDYAELARVGNDVSETAVNVRNALASRGEVTSFAKSSLAQHAVGDSTLGFAFVWTPRETITRAQVDSVVLYGANYHGGGASADAAWEPYTSVFSSLGGYVVANDTIEEGSRQQGAVAGDGWLAENVDVFAKNEYGGNRLAASLGNPFGGPGGNGAPVNPLVIVGAVIVGAIALGYLLRPVAELIGDIKG